MVGITACPGARPMVNNQESTTVQTVYAAIELSKTNW